MKKQYEYRHVTIPFSDDQMVLIGLPLPDDQRAPLDVILLTALNEAGTDGWRVVPPLVLPIVLLERETQHQVSRG